MCKFVFFFFLFESSFAQVALDAGGASGGAIRPGASTTTCDASANGSVRWSSANTCVELCNGTSWQCLLNQVCLNSTPTAFTWTTQINVATSTVISSNIVQITGATGCTLEVGISGTGGTPELRTCTDSACASVIQTWTSSKTGITNNQYLQIRLTSSASANTTFAARVNAGTTVATWQVTTSGSACTDTNPVVGTFCADGSVFAGISPDSGKKMYATPCPQGLTWNGSACTGTATTHVWSTTNTIFNGISSDILGASNTASIVALSNADAPYPAANQCDALTFGTKTDWYLPAENEVDLLITACGLIPGIPCTSGTNHWTSSESTNTNATYWRPNNQVATIGKTSAQRVHCVRKD